MKYLLAASILAILVQAQITYKKSHPEELRKLRVPPHVEASACDDACVFKNSHDSWCFRTTPPMIKIGWEWEQEYEETSSTDPIPNMDYYWWTLQPYADVRLYLNSLFNIENLYYNELKADLS